MVIVWSALGVVTLLTAIVVFYKLGIYVGQKIKNKENQS